MNTERVQLRNSPTGIIKDAPAAKKALRQPRPAHV
jgi:hypothetical protein